MEVDPQRVLSPLPRRSNPSLFQSSRGSSSSSKNPKSPRTAPREPRSKRAYALSQISKFGVSKVRLPGSKPLLPAGERRSGGHDKNKEKGEAGGEKGNNITPDGGSAGREGRHFTVSNVGNNGQIYLRPTVRPANQRYPQPNFVFPLTPPSTAGIESLAPNKAGPDEISELLNGQWTPSPAADSSSFGGGVAKKKKNTYFDLKAPPKTRNRRALSDSTIQDVSIAQEGDAGVFKVVISKPKDELRSKTAEDVESIQSPLMQISIPSWKLGTPRFTLMGTPLLRGSSYAPTEDPRSSTLSFYRPSAPDLNSLHPESSDTAKERINSTSHMDLQTPELLSPATIISPRTPRSPRFPPFASPRSTYLSTHIVIEPAMFDALTFKPACDDRSIVRYSSTTNAVTAATPPRLVAEITSPTFLDYELISDFFLTFRSFLDTQDLLRMLIARLRWAILRDDETGMVVRVRTFVATRHWILNYFVDDFVVDYHLRVMFCNLINDFVEELSQDERGRKVQLKILAELKKCWRRVCSQFWDGPEFDTSLGPEIPIASGGIAGHRDPSLDPSFWESESDDLLQLYGVPLHPGSDIRYGSNPNADPSQGNMDSILLDGVRPGTPGEERSPMEMERRQASPTSTASFDVVSCSFPIPSKGFRMGDPIGSSTYAAHPADPSSIYTNVDPVAPTPRTLTGKRVRPHTSHRRNTSLTDSLREHGSTTEKVLYKNAEFLLTLPYSGSLVRGNLLPPGQALVEVNTPNPWSTTRQTTLFQPSPIERPKEKCPGSAMSGQGMRKLIGSVRRALSTRGQGVSPTQGNFIDIAPIGPRGATINRLPGTAVVPQARPTRMNGARAPVRIDVLGATIAEDFKKAVREDNVAESIIEDSNIEDNGDRIAYSPAHLDSSFNLRPVSDAGITTGSKSIVIVDGTLSGGYPAMASPFTIMNPSMEAFADSMIRHDNVDLTPPNTPPGQTGRRNIPRRSSHLLGQFGQYLASESLPPFVPDMDTLDPGSPEGTHAPASPSSRSVETVKQSPREVPTSPREAPVSPREAPVSPREAQISPREAPASPHEMPISPRGPPISYISRHRRQKSSRSYRTRSSMTHRRWASFQSGIAAQSTIRSFDATTCSDGSRMSEVMPQPLRVLRRRPGGDLRCATNVHDLDAPLHRSRSVGSLTTYSESIRSSYLRSPVRESTGYAEVVSSNYSERKAELFSLGVMTEQVPKQPVTLCTTHSSKPIMRPSFEAEAERLARIPDDTDDDGGVESALLKLEGKFERRIAKLSMEPKKIFQSGLQDLKDRPVATPEVELVKGEKRKHRRQHVGDDDVPIVSPIEGDPDTPLAGNRPFPRDSEVSFLSEDSRETYNSTPLLDRGLTDDGHSKTTTQEWADNSALAGTDTPPVTIIVERDDGMTNSSLSPSFEFVQMTESINKIQSEETGETGPDDSVYPDSDNDSALSSEISGELPDPDDYIFGEPHMPKRPSPIDTGSSPRGTGNKPPSPPMTVTQASATSPESAYVPQLHEHQLWAQKPLPPTPETTPTTAIYHHGSQPSKDPTGTEQALRNAPVLSGEEGQKNSAHLPFILAFDSEILAQQFTLIEKDALNEVDWKELIDMRWKNANNDSRSWVDFLRNTDAQGVEVVVARFNIMVKWVISEIVLTQGLEERARCIIKFLHIAVHCRRYRNFATMSQIAIALTSNEVTRLSRTWEMVTPADMQTMKDLETLVSPTKNFYNLRAEMEGGGNGTDTGCIPFFGIYTHDLLFNSQRPSEIASSPTTAPLVNFERCRIAAAVVKTLLRLLEASTHYEFQPIEGITERCLWMSALSDEEIRKLSENLE
ncbi:ras GEF [Hypoxylon fragiforme]|uniref:ras GEF n=1 Tax=Hypoxylon fragiforme TaxID=63214 RepID=UPI0020C5E399|nr:ras GEF [Hypoxylon fragiforme]KAI2611298.1 ras GEF [Hypoxylon fragiforme]